MRRIVAEMCLKYLLAKKNRTLNERGFKNIFGNQFNPSNRF